MKKRALFSLLAPVSRAVARQLARPSGWFGRTVMTRFLNRGNRELIGATLDQLQLTAETALLDVGFGGGGALERAWRLGVRQLHGVDPSPEAVAAVRARSASFAGAQLRAEVGVVEALPFEDASLDAIVSTNTVYFWPSLGAAFSELHRVLRPGGRLALGYSGAAKLRGFDVITRHGFHFHERAQLEAAARAAGLHVVRHVELHGGDTEGDLVLVAERPASAPAA